jgi:histidinol dehydrogenase
VLVIVEPAPGSCQDGPTALSACLKSEVGDDTLGSSGKSTGDFQVISQPMRATASVQMNFIDLTSEGETAWRKRFDRRYLPSNQLVQKVQAILSRVRAEGDVALIDFIRQFDKAEMTAKELRVRQEEITLALGHLDPELLDALSASKKNVQEFAQRSRRTDWQAENVQGGTVGERFDPIRRVGIYVPAGTA